MAWPRSFRRRAASASEKAPAAASAEYSPSEWPATNFTLSASRKPFSLSSTRMTASDTAISAGWAFSVSVRVSIGPSNMISDSFWPSAASTSSNTARAAGIGLGQLGAHADGLAALPWKHECDGHARPDPTVAC